MRRIIGLTLICCLQAAACGAVTLGGAIQTRAPADKKRHSQPVTISKLDLTPVAQILDHTVAAYLRGRYLDLKSPEFASMAAQYANYSERSLALNRPALRNLAGTNEMCEEFVITIRSMGEALSAKSRLALEIDALNEQGTLNSMTKRREISDFDLPEADNKLDRIEQAILKLFRNHANDAFNRLLLPGTYYLLNGLLVQQQDVRLHNRILVPDFDLPSECLIATDVITDYQGWLAAILKPDHYDEWKGHYDLFTRQFCDFKRGDIILAVRRSGGAWVSVSNWRDLAQVLSRLRKQSIFFFELHLQSPGEDSRMVPAEIEWRRPGRAPV